MFFMSLTWLIICHNDKSPRAKWMQRCVLQCLHCRCWAPSPKDSGMVRGSWSEMNTRVSQQAQQGANKCKMSSSGLEKNLTALRHRGWGVSTGNPLLEVNNCGRSAFPSWKSSESFSHHITASLLNKTPAVQDVSSEGRLIRLDGRWGEILKERGPLRCFYAPDFTCISKSCICFKDRNYSFKTQLY